MTAENNVMAFFNGAYIPLSQVHISPMDRGFLFGDGIYEVIPIYSGVPLGGEQHWQRLLAGLAATGMATGMTLSDLQQAAEPLLNPDEPAQMLYVQITRGVEPVRKHRFPVQATPTVLMFSMPFTPPVTAEYPGCAAWFQQDLRWQRCGIKSISLMGNVMAYYQLWKQGAENDEALLVRDSTVVEAPSSNLFAVIDGRVLTPPEDNILSGITRHLVMELVSQQGLELVEQAPEVSQLQQASEIWVSNSYEELKPVVLLEGKPVGAGQPGPVWKAIFQAYQGLKA